MNTLEPSLDWNLLRAFLAVADAGSLTGAALRLASSQPTLSRQIAELEKSMHMELFERVARGLRLTAAGEALLPYARQMQTAAHAVSLTALGQSQELAGTVRLTASEMTGTYILPDILAGLRRQHPQIQIELVVSNQVENLLERQADIAVRHARPSQTGLIAQYIGNATVAGFAHESYLQSVGGHIDMMRAQDYDWIGYDSSDLLLRGFRAAGLNVGREFFALRCDNHLSCWNMAVAGMGICFATTLVASRWPQMRSVLPPESNTTLPVWVTAHRELRQSARIRVVFDALALGLRSMVA